MATKTYNLRRTADGCITVRVGRQIESISTHARSKSEVFDAVRWALISKGVYISEVKLVEDLDNV